MLESLFNNVAGLKAGHFIKKRLTTVIRNGNIVWKHGPHLHEF